MSVEGAQTLDEFDVLGTFVPVIGMVQSDADEAAILDAMRVRAARLLYGR